MRTPTLLFLLVPVLTAEGQYDATNKYQVVDDTDMRTGDIEPLFAYSGRHKRSSSAALRAWARLARTTQGFRWIKLKDGFKSKTYIKVGGLQDAMDDFISLKPTSVKNWGSELTGIAWDQGVKLRTPTARYPILRLYFGGKDNSLRTITYVETPAQVPMALRNLDEISIP